MVNRVFHVGTVDKFIIFPELFFNVKVINKS